MLQTRHEIWASVDAQLSYLPIKVSPFLSLVDSAKLLVSMTFLAFAPADSHVAGADIQSLPVELFDELFQDMVVSERYALFLLSQQWCSDFGGLTNQLITIRSPSLHRFSTCRCSM